MQKRWRLKAQLDQVEVRRFGEELKVNEVIASLLLQRGLQTYNQADEFLRPSLARLHDSLLMKGMHEAIDRVNKAIVDNEKILLFGDYDVDGTTAVALMFSCLKKHCQRIDYYIPDRYQEGYGVSFLGIDKAKELGVSLIISLDCGIRSTEQIKYASTQGIDFIVCDHHNPGNEIPQCIVLDPKQKDCQYPFKELSGCGVGFKLLQGLFTHNSWNADLLYEHLDLLAVSIGADIVPVTGENRILCFHGMTKLNANPRKAFSQLIQYARKTFPITLTDVVFSIAPRINAAGRLQSGKFAVELMISENEDEIIRIAGEIDAYNQERRYLDQLTTTEALEMIENDTDHISRKSTVIFNTTWHKGIVGIVASRLIEKHHRPTIVLTQSEGKVTGSARSIPNFNIYEALLKCEHLLEQFGGHQYAAGMTLKPENVSAFRLHFETIVYQSLGAEDETPEEIIDMEISFDRLFTSGEDRRQLPRLVKFLDQFEPFGPENMKPVFLAKNVYAMDIRVLKDAHLKLSMVQPNCDLVVEGIGFNLSDRIEFVASGLPFDLIFTMEKNRWNNRESLQLNIKDIRPSV